MDFGKTLELVPFVVRDLDIVNTKCNSESCDIQF